MSFHEQKHREDRGFMSLGSGAIQGTNYDFFALEREANVALYAQYGNGGHQFQVGTIDRKSGEFFGGLQPGVRECKRRYDHVKSTGDTDAFPDTNGILLPTGNAANPFG